MIETSVKMQLVDPSLYAVVSIPSVQLPISNGCDVWQICSERCHEHGMSLGAYDYIPRGHMN